MKVFSLRRLPQLLFLCGLVVRGRPFSVPVLLLSHALMVTYSHFLLWISPLLCLATRARSAAIKKTGTAPFTHSGQHRANILSISFPHGNIILVVFIKVELEEDRALMIKRCKWSLMNAVRSDRIIKPTCQKVENSGMCAQIFELFRQNTGTDHRLGVTLITSTLLCNTTQSLCQQS